MPSKAATDTVEQMVAAESVLCVDLLDRRVGCVMAVATARISAEPVRPSMGMAETGSKTVSAAGEIDPRPAQPSILATEVETRTTNLRGGSARPSILIRG